MQGQNLETTFAVFLSNNNSFFHKEIEDAINSMLIDSKKFEKNQLLIEYTNEGVQLSYPAEFLKMNLFKSNNYPHIKYDAHVIIG